ncbi:MAG: 4-hydroxy-tetrahydrodipicolinate reductase [Candidatus Adiutrix sp.]|jgi:4-hydroxy-tetrahydrodipicolinate reductase|nr:4-hydroxy-tetrahydrodipicolinate reductase [Candidatus Adiutrix sp.]
MTEAKPIRAAVCGAMGRMGQSVVRAALRRPGFSVVGVVERPGHPLLGQNIGPLAGAAELDLTLTSSLAEAAVEADLYIDFTTPEASLAYLREAAELKIGAVIGATGFDEAQKEKLRAAGRAMPVLWAPNMSIGVNVMYKIAGAMAAMLGPDYDIEIVEAHHNQKKDAPSGTALKLQETLAATRGLKPEETLVTGRAGQCGVRGRDEIAVLAIRGGDIIGDHTVYFAGPGERLELTHRAGARDTFAQGALRAAAWLAGRAPGLYSLDDVMIPAAPA